MAEVGVRWAVGQFWSRSSRKGWNLRRERGNGRDGSSQGSIDIDVVVVGAGQGGLGIAYYLAQAGVDFVVLEPGG